MLYIAMHVHGGSSQTVRLSWYITAQAAPAWTTT